MRKLVLMVLIGALAIGLVGKNIPNPGKYVSAAMQSDAEPEGELVSFNAPQGGYSTGLREGNAVLIDSSLNGYGMISSETNPISVNPYDTDKIVMAYRQYDVNNNSSSGAIGSAVSLDGGESWGTSSNLNFGLGLNVNGGALGRYPSVLAAENYPVVLWNEYGIQGGFPGGGEFGGRAYYTFDLFNYGGGFWFPGVDFHPSPLSHDTWNLAVTQNVDDAGDYVINIVAGDNSGNKDRIHFRAQSNGAWQGTTLPMIGPNILVENSLDFRFDGEDNYTSNGNMDINDDGVGYYALTSYWHNENEIANHTLFVKQTTDFGLTWSDWFYLSDENSIAHFSTVFPDSVQDSDSSWAHLAEDWAPFLGYDTEVLTDANGGFHAFVPVLPSETDGLWGRWSDENGLYHFYAEDANFLAGSGSLDLSISFLATQDLTWAVIGGSYSYQYNGMSMATDINDDSKLYATYYAVSDTITIGADWFAYFDVFGSYSDDNGATWSEGVNLTHTFEPNLDEMYPHMNRFGVDGEVYIMYQMPDYNQGTVADPENGQDYLNKVYFMKTTLGPVSVDNEVAQPATFELKENYPNPFNPSTTIGFSIPTSGMVELTVYDITGRAVETLHQGFLTSGNYQYTFAGNNLASGAYFYSLKSQGFQDVKKMLLIK